jgi:LysR family transcriptional regulator (chromosome initiation inhibitor)
MLDYKQIEALAVVVEEGGFERAARTLYLTQSAVSQRVRQLEERTGQVLLSRTTPPCPTAAGRQLIKHYRQVKLLEESLATELTEANDDSPITLAVGVNADSLALWFLDAVGALLESGKLLLDLRVDDQEQTHKLLRDGEVVGCISTEEKAMQGCRIEALGSMSYRLLATPEFAGVWFPGGLTPEACGKAPAVIFNRKDNLHHQHLQQIFDRPPARLPAHYVPSPEPFLAMIVSGNSYGMVPDLQGQALLQSGALLELTPGQPLVVDLYWHCWNLDARFLNRLTGQLVAGATGFLAKP